MPQLLEQDTEIATVEITAKPPLVIYHADCNDGLAAAWCVMDAYRSIGTEVELYAAKYQTPPPDVTNRFVIIVDFSYKRPVLLQMLEKATRIEIYDHHKSAREDLEGLDHEKLLVVFDMERSGAGITWDEFHLDEGSEPTARPWFIDYIEDNDLWRHKLPECKAVLEWLRSHPTAQHFDFFDANKYGDVPDFVFRDGRAILRAKKILVEQAMTFAHRVQFQLPEGLTEMFVSNVPFFLASEVGHALAERNKATSRTPVGITYYRQADGRWSLSFRSVDGYDCSQIALKFGGGGHKGAAGATVDALPWPVVATQTVLRTA